MPRSKVRSGAPVHTSAPKRKRTSKPGRWAQLVVGGSQLKLTPEDPGFKGINLAMFDWGYACYLAKRGDLSELITMLRNESSTYSPPPPRARLIIASLLEHRGKFKRRHRLTRQDVKLARGVFSKLSKKIPSKKKGLYLLAKSFGVSESTIRDALSGRRDFAGI